MKSVNKKIKKRNKRVIKYKQPTQSQIKKTVSQIKQGKVSTAIPQAFSQVSYKTNESSFLRQEVAIKEVAKDIINKQEEIDSNVISNYIDSFSDYEKIHRLEIDDENIQSRLIPRKFGGEVDYVEFHLYDSSNNKILSVHDFTQYEFPPGTEGTESNELLFNPKKILNQIGYQYGRFKIILNFQRQILFDVTPPTKIFKINKISSDRREIRAVTSHVDNFILDNQIGEYIDKIESSYLFTDFVCNFNDNKIELGINLGLDTKNKNKYEVLIKLYEPLEDDIEKGDTFNLTTDIMEPISFEIDLGEAEDIDNSIELQGPNFRVDTRLLNSIPSAFKNYDNILTYSVTSSYQSLLQKLENIEPIEIDYDYIKPINDTESTDVNYHFDNFVHFGSAVERLKNFEYKLKLTELYNTQIDDINTIGGNTSESVAVLNNKTNINDKITNILKGLDGYERFLYYTSGTYAWPKTNSTPPYTLYPVTSSQAKTWIGSEVDPSIYYGGQLLSASLFDRTNDDNLINLIPLHIKENDDNNPSFLFVNMLGQHFDQIWTYIKHITKQKQNDHKYGVSKDLVSFALQSLGISTFDQFENAGLIEYILGEGTGSNFYDVQHYSGSTPTETLVTASNEGSIPKGDITKEIWKRLYNNVPYLLKHKGTERGIKALMSCYGLPSTILNVKEYGGPTKNKETTTSFSYDKYSLSLDGDSGTNGYFIKTQWSSSLINDISATSKTVEFRIKPIRSASGEDYHLFSLSGSTNPFNNTYIPRFDTHLILNTYTGSADISSSGDGDQFGRLQLYVGNALSGSTDYFPVYNGDFWNIHIAGVNTSGSSGYGSNDTVYFGAYQSNWLKNTSKHTATASIPHYSAFQLPYYKVCWGLYISGAKEVIIGGVPNNLAPEYDTVDPLRYSGSIQEVRYHIGERLSDNTLTKHSLEPFMYSGNSLSSSFNNLVLRLPLGSNNKEDSSSFHPNIAVDYVPSSSISSNMSTQKWESNTETHHLTTPDAITMSSEKVRTDSGSVDDNILSPFIMAESPTFERQAEDYEDLGIFFSPTTEINEDILYTLGNFRFDDYIGSSLPSDQNSSEYRDVSGITGQTTGNSLNTLKDLYYKKVNLLNYSGTKRFNYRDYIKLIQYIDHTLFKIIEQYVPARANLKTGVLIEPHYLERNKFSRNLPTTDEYTTMLPNSHNTFLGTIDTAFVSASYHLHSASIDIDDYLLDEVYLSAQAPINPVTTGGTPKFYKAYLSSVLLGNATKSTLSNIYFRSLQSGSESDY